MDSAAVRAAGAHPAGLVTCRTQQSPRGVFGVKNVPTSEILAGLALLARDLPPAAVKLGLFGAPGTARAVAGFARRLSIPLVVDPVVRSSTGTLLVGRAGMKALREELLPAAAVLTPNREEAGILSGLAIESVADAVTAARKIAAMGPQAVLVKGLRAPRRMRVDILATAAGRVRRFSSLEIDGADPHGTGCTLASALAARLAAGDPLEKAVRRARRVVRAAIRSRFRPVRGGLDLLGPTWGSFWMT